MNCAGQKGRFGCSGRKFAKRDESAPGKIPEVADMADMTKPSGLTSLLKRSDRLLDLWPIRQSDRSPNRSDRSDLSDQNADWT